MPSRRPPVSSDNRRTVPCSGSGSRRPARPAAPLLDRRSRRLLDQTQGWPGIWVDTHTVKQAVAAFAVSAAWSARTSWEVDPHPGCPFCWRAPLARICLPSGRQGPHQVAAAQ